MTHANLTAAKVMTKNLHTVAADWPIDRLVDFLADHAISGAPVVTEAQKPIGVVSLTDLARAGGLGQKPANGSHAHAFYRHDLVDLVAREEKRTFHVRDDEPMTVGDIMTPMVFSVDEGASVQEVADAMIKGRIHRVLVTRAGQLVGIVSAIDLLPLVRDL
jgi:CBS domain-containing protein